MFEMQNVCDVGCLGCLGMWDVWYVGCLGMWDVCWDVGC